MSQYERQYSLYNHQIPSRQAGAGLVPPAQPYDRTD